MDIGCENEVVERTAQEGSDEGLAEVGFIRFLTRQANRKWLIVKVVVVFGLLGVLLAVLLPVRYTAVCKITTPQPAPSAAILLSNQLSRESASSLTGLASGIGFGLKNPNDLYIGLLGSRTIADDLIQQYSLRSVYRTRNLTLTRKALASNTKFSSEKSGLISISVTDRDKTRAAKLANSYPQRLRVLMKSMAAADASDRRAYYENQIREARDQLSQTEFAFRQIQVKKGVVVPDAQSRAIILSAANLRAEIASKQMELDAARLGQTENSPAIRALQANLASLQSTAERMDKEGTFKSLGLQGLASASLDYLEAQHEMQYRQILLDMLLKQYDAARLDESKEAAVVEVVEPAVVPEMKSSPMRTVIVILFVLLGALAAILYVEIAAFADRHPEFRLSLGEFRRALFSLRG